jgi:hypothetical protein
MLRQSNVVQPETIDRHRRGILDTVTTPPRYLLDLPQHSTLDKTGTQRCLRDGPQTRNLPRKILQASDLVDRRSQSRSKRRGLSRRMEQQRLFPSQRHNRLQLRMLMRRITSFLAPCGTPSQLHLHRVSERLSRTDDYSPHDVSDDDCRPDDTSDSESSQLLDLGPWFDDLRRRVIRQRGARAEQVHDRGRESASRHQNSQYFVEGSDSDSPVAHRGNPQERTRHPQPNMRRLSPRHPDGM